jgi:hypothetical protein
MKVELSRSGGFFASIKKASIDVDWNDEDAEQILSAMQEHADEQKRDAIHYTLSLQGKTALINLNKIPERYQEVFDHLQKNLKNV